MVGWSESSYCRFEVDLWAFWVVKLSSTGAIECERILGVTNIETAKDIEQTSDGGYIIAGSSNSNDGDVGGNNGSYDAWIVKLNSFGFF